MDFKEFKETFTDILPILYKAAPLIGSFIGTPATSIIIALIAAVTNNNPCDHATLAAQLKNDPDLFLKLQSLEATHGDWLKKMQD